MNNRVPVLIKVVGILCLAYSLTQIPPMLVSLWYDDGNFDEFGKTFLLLSITGAVLWLYSRDLKVNLHRRDGFLVVALFWITLSLVSALPLLLGPAHLDSVDALFEAVSGFTTTGATVVTDLDRLPPSILYYRQQLQWLGGMGLVVLAIAVLPILGVGGASLYRAETPGPMKDEKLTPRLIHTARSLWLIYIFLTAVCAFAYWLAGMSLLEAVEHSFSTLSTGGYSPHDESLGYFQNQTINYIAIVFMLLGAIHFGVHFTVFRQHKPLLYIFNAEVRAFLIIITAFVLVISSGLYLGGTYENFYEAFHYSLFEIVSVITTTGYGVADFSIWPTFIPPMLIFMSFIGGCSGSTAGGMKIIRILLLCKQAAHEGFVLVHPKAVRPVRIGSQILDEPTTQAIWGFFAVYVIVFVTLTLCMMLTGLDQVSAFAAVATCITNLGPGLGEVSTSFAGVSDTAKFIGMVAMLLGRLEIFTLIILLMPDFWRA